MNNNDDKFPPRGPDRRHKYHDEKRAAPDSDRRKKSHADHLQLEGYASKAFAVFLGAAIQHVGLTGVFEEGKKVNFEAVSRLSWLSAKAMVRHGRDFVEEQDKNRA